ncbi:MAG: hypothetical protein KAR19_13040 [Bacteroidales bacterium]|nr:hypothetical protein [Bacteroidales bacterium]
MNPKERVLNILDRKPVDRIPIDVLYTPEVENTLKMHVRAKNDFEMWKKLGLDKIVWVFMDYQTESGEAHYQEFVEPPMSGYETPADAEKYPFWPDPDRFKGTSKNLFY